MIRASILTLLASVPGVLSAVEPAPLPRFSGLVEVVGDLVLLTPVDFGHRVRVSFPVGELQVVASDVTAIHTNLRVGCERLSPALCDKYRGRLRLEASQADGVVEVRLVGLPRWKLRRLRLEGAVEVPRWAPLEMRVGIGDVDVWSGDEDLTVVMGIGDLTVHAPRARIGSVHARARIGDASLAGEVQREGQRRMLIGAAIDWSGGAGAAAIDIGLRIGDATVVLE